MVNFYRRGNLRHYAAIVTIVASLAAIITYAIVSYSSNMLIQHHFSGREFNEARKDYYTQSLQQFANDHQMKSNDEALLQEWTEIEKYLYVRIFHDGPPLAESGYTFHENTNASVNIDPVLQTSVSITFADGTYTVTFDDYSYIRYVNLWQLLAVAIAFWPLLVVAVLYIHELSKDITRISRSAKIIESGTLDQPIPIPEDAPEEILSLASCMDDMRSSLNERFEQDRQRMLANQDLLTTMSHDIRTPLTTLIGYAEILNQNTSLSEEDREKYTSIVYNRALRLKELTDEMFFYFLVYGSSEVKIEMAEFNSQILIPQLLSDYLSILESNNAVIDYSMDEYHYIVRTDITSLQHVFDNVFSNVRKHGDLAKPVSIRIGRREDDYIHVTTTNYIPEVSPNVESTHVGLRTCEKLMGLIGGSFEFKSDGSQFTADVLIPIVISTRMDVI